MSIKRQKLSAQQVDQLLILEDNDGSILCELSNYVLNPS